MKINLKEKRHRNFGKKFFNKKENYFIVESLVNILGHQYTVIYSTIL